MGCPPGAEGTDSVLARPPEAAALARRKVAPALLRGLERRGESARPPHRPSRSLLVPGRLWSGGWCEGASEGQGT